MCFINVLTENLSVKVLVQNCDRDEQVLHLLNHSEEQDIHSVENGQGKPRK